MADPVNHPVHQCLSETYTKKCSSKIEKKTLDLSGIGFGDKIAYILYNVLTPEECQNLIRETESAGYTPALVHHGKEARLIKGYRDSYRVMIDDPTFSATIFERIERLLPLKFTDYRGAVHILQETNERLRFLRYDPGDKFQQHYDGCYSRPDGSARTMFTLQLYLNEEMEGGETTFLAPPRFKSELKRVPVKPVTGSVLVFQHDILHEGSEVTAGRKYTIRMDVLYKFDKVETEKAKEKARTRKDPEERKYRSCILS